LDAAKELSGNYDDLTADEIKSLNL
jgi:hypothetical protein